MQPSSSLELQHWHRVSGSAQKYLGQTLDTQDYRKAQAPVSESQDFPGKKCSSHKHTLAHLDQS